jgi:hypothetical protein
MFVTKLLRTNSGQCHSLPLLYKLLADRLGIAARLSMAPNHSYIQVVGPDGELYSYETTNGHLITIGCVSAVTRGKLFRRNQLKAQGAVNKIFNFSKCLSTGGFKLIKSGFSHFQCT